MLTLNLGMLPEPATDALRIREPVGQGREAAIGTGQKDKKQPLK
jgi:hypothetical protein